MVAETESAEYILVFARECHITTDKEVKAVRITQSFEWGAIINLHHLEHQVIGSIEQTLGGALLEAVEWSRKDKY